MAAIVTVENPEAAEDATSSVEATEETVLGNIQAFFKEENTSMMGGWTN
ncbi:hypothetical protein ABZW10_28400 [Kitasatospora sp. NPDC004723]